MKQIVKIRQIYVRKGVMEEYRPSQKLLETLDRHPQSLYRYRMILIIDIHDINDYLKYQSRQLGSVKSKTPLTLNPEGFLLINKLFNCSLFCSLDLNSLLCCFVVVTM